MAIEQLQRRLRRPMPNWVPLLIVTIGLGLLVQLLVSMLLAEGAYKLADLKREHRALQTEVQIISQEVDSLASPQYLADSANRLGMVVDPSPVFLDLKLGKVYGDPSAAAKGGDVAARNLVANSALGSLTEEAASVVAASGEVEESRGDEASSGEVQTLSEIPASPTR